MDSRVKYKERKSSFRIIHRFNLLNCRTLVVEKQHGMLERGMFWKPSVLSLILQLYSLLNWKHSSSYIFSLSISSLIFYMRIIILSQRFL